MAAGKNFPKRCNSCGRVYDRAAWKSLLYRGVMGDDLDPPEPLELRNCICDSTLAVRLDPRGRALDGLRGLGATPEAVLAALRQRALAGDDDALEVLQDALADRGEELDESFWLNRRTIVIIRVWKPIFAQGFQGEWIVLFPEEFGDNEYECQSYMHQGGYGSAHPLGVGGRTRPVRSQSLVEEEALIALDREGYQNLVVRQKFTYAMQKKRADRWRRYHERLMRRGS